MTRRNLFPLIAAPQLAQIENPKTEKLKEEVRQDFYKNAFTKLKNKYKVLLNNAAADLKVEISKASLKSSRSGVNPYVFFRTEKEVLLIRDAHLLKLDVLGNLIDEYAQFGYYFAGPLLFLGTDGFNLVAEMIYRNHISMSAEEANIKFAN